MSQLENRSAFGRPFLPILAFIAFLAIVLRPDPSLSATRYVADCAPCIGVTYYTLTNAVAAAASGDVIVLQKSVTESPGAIDSKFLAIEGPGPTPVYNWTSGPGANLVTLMNNTRLTVRYLNLDCRANMILEWTNPQRPISLVGCTLRKSVQVVNSPMISLHSWDATAPLCLEKCDVIGNGAVQASFIRGDGNMNSGPYVVMVNTVLHDFNATGASAVELYPAVSRSNLFDIRHCTFGNVWVGLYTTNNSTGAVTNTVFSSLSADVSMGTGSRAAFSACAFERTLGGWNANCITITGANEFNNPALGDYRLKAGAACIDHGVNLPSVPVDKDGIARPVNALWDIGAYEYNGPAVPTPTPTTTSSNTPSQTPTDSATETPSMTATLSFSPTTSLSPTDTPSVTSSWTGTATFEASGTPSETATPTSSPTLTASLTPTPTESPTGTFTPTSTPTDSATDTPAVTDTATVTSTPTPTDSPIETPTDTPTLSPTSTETATPSETDTPSMTATLSSTATPSPSSTPSWTATFTPTETSTETRTATDTPTDSPTETPVDTDTSTETPTETPTDTSTPSDTPTASWTETSSPSDTATVPASPSATFTPTPSDSPTTTPTIPPSAASRDFVLDGNRFDPIAGEPLGIEFTSPGGSVELSVYNVAGLKVRNLLEASLPPGSRRLLWDGRDDRGACLQPGLYLVALEREGRRKILKVLVRPR